MRFNFKSPLSSRPSLLVLIYSYGGEKLKISTGLHVYPKYWNKSHHRVKKSHPNSKLINDFLDQLEVKLNRKVLEHELTG